MEFFLSMAFVGIAVLGILANIEHARAEAMQTYAEKLQKRILTLEDYINGEAARTAAAVAEAKAEKEKEHQENATRCWKAVN